MEDNAKEGSNPISDEHRKWIDEASYAEMLGKNRFSPLEDPLFLGETGEYFLRVISEKRNKLKPGEAVTISKMIGWGP